MDAEQVRQRFGPELSEAAVEKLVGRDLGCVVNLMLELSDPPSAAEECANLFRSCGPYRVGGNDSADDIRKFLMDFTPLRDSVPTSTLPLVNQFVECFKTPHRPSAFASTIGGLVCSPSFRGIGEEYVGFETASLQTIWETLDRWNPDSFALGLMFGKNVTEKGDQYFKVFKPGLKPDSHVTCNGSLLLYSEEKRKEEEFSVAKRELVDKLAELPPWLYGKLKFLVCYVATPGKIQFYMMQISKSGPELKKIAPLLSKQDPIHRTIIVLIAFNLYFLLLGMQEAVYSQPAYPLHSDMDNGSSIIRLSLKGARKIIPVWDEYSKANEVVFETVKVAYTAARKARGHLISCILEPEVRKLSEIRAGSSSSESPSPAEERRPSLSLSSSASSSLEKKHPFHHLDPNTDAYVVETRPLCGRRPPSTETDLRDLAIGVLHALAALHSEGLVHRDIREPNIMYDYSKRKYVLIDLEGVTKVDEKPRMTYKCWDECTLDDGAFTKESDYQLLGLLLSSYEHIEKSASCKRFIDLLLSRKIVEPLKDMFLCN